MAIGRRRRAQHTALQDINVSPLIDMVFILLIFFIVTTVFVDETGVEITKPKAASARQLEQNSIQIAITSAGGVIHADREIGVSGVRPTVVRLSAREPLPVIIQADREVPTHLLVRVLDEAKLAGAPAVSIATDE